MKRYVGWWFAALSVAAAPAASAQEPVKVRLADAAQSQNGIASQVIIDLGLDKKHGFKLEYSAYPTLDGLFNAIRGKQADVGFGGWTAFSQFRSQGFPVMSIFPVGRGTSLDILVPVNSPIKTIDDLKGKKVGSYAGAAGTATVLFRVITAKYYGFDPGKTGHLQFAAPGLLTKLMSEGELDAALLFDPLAARAIASGQFRVVGNLSELYRQKSGKDFLWITYATNDEFAAKHADVLVAFNRAWQEAVAYVMKNDKPIDDYAAKVGMDAAGAKLLRERIRADYVLTWNDEFIRNFTAFAVEAREVMGPGFLETVPPASFSTRFVAR
jgi:NitT/TauT family transport system substrate-binding protein